MINTITLKELRPDLPEVIDAIDTKLSRYIVTRRGKPVAVMLSMEDYENIIETLEILADKSLIKRIKKAKEEIKGGKTVSLEELCKRIEHV